MGCGKCRSKHSSCGCPQYTTYVPPPTSFKLGLYTQTYTVNSATVISTILAGATGGTVTLTPIAPQTSTPAGTYFVGGRFNVAGSAVNQIALGVGGITVQNVSGVPQLVVPGYGATAGADVLASLVTFGLATGTTFTAGTTATLYFACL